MDVASRRGLSRRGCLCCLFASAMAGVDGLTPRQARADAPGIVDQIKAAAAAAPIAIHRVRGGIAILEGSGGNVAVLSGRDGKVMVDAGIAVSRPQMETALGAVGPGPVTHLINTHWHFDHASGNEWLRDLGPTILAHENARKRLQTLQRVADWNYDFQPLSAAALPTELVTEERTLRVGGIDLVLKPYGPAHTDSDLSVFFREPNVLHAGDTFWNGVYPFIDYSSGGSVDGSIRAAETNWRSPRTRPS